MKNLIYIIVIVVGLGFVSSSYATTVCNNVRITNIFVGGVLGAVIIDYQDSTDTSKNGAVRVRATDNDINYDRFYTSAQVAASINSLVDIYYIEDNLNCFQGWNNPKTLHGIKVKY